MTLLKFKEIGWDSYVPRCLSAEKVKGINQHQQKTTSMQCYFYFIMRSRMNQHPWFWS